MLYLLGRANVRAMVVRACRLSCCDRAQRCYTVQGFQPYLGIEEFYDGVSVEGGDNRQDKKCESARRGGGRRESQASVQVMQHAACESITRIRLTFEFTTPTFWCFFFFFPVLRSG